MNAKHLLAASMLLLLAACSGPVGGGIADGPDWLFTGKGPVTLTTKVPFTGEADLSLVTDLSLMADEPEVVFTATATVGEDSILTIGLGKLRPGFYEVRLRDSVRFNIGVRPEKVKSPVDSHPDIKEFWDNTLSEMKQIPLDATWELVSEASNELRQSYRIKYESFGGAIAGGLLCIPVKEGKYPVHIQYMGYGADVYNFDPSANPDRIDFLVSVRGQGIFREPEARWIDRGLDSRENFYYRGAFADAVRAVDFVATLDKADMDRVVAYGESQGGALTVAAAALDHRIKAIAPAVPFLGDYRDYYKIVWWPVHEVMDTVDSQGLDREEVYDMLTYFDVKNLAPWVECPAYMSWGLQDPTCPPHTNFAIFNNLGSREKHWWCVPTCGHAMWREPSWPPVRDSFLSRFTD